MNKIPFRYHFIPVFLFLSWVPNSLSGQSTDISFAPPYYNTDSLSVSELLEQLTLNDPTHQINIIKSLRKFKFKNYSDTDKDKLSAFLFSHKNVSKDLILLSGFLRMNETLTDLAIKYKSDKSQLQHTNLALVRAGDQAKTATLHKNLLKITVNDDFVYEVLPLLVYTKHPDIYNWLLTVIMSDKKNCHPADAETAGHINCAYRIIEAIAPNIIDFPLELDKWGDLKVDTYSHALVIVREWIIQNQASYPINTQTY